MTRLLLDANLSPETREYLSARFGFDVVDLISERKATLSDEQVVAFSKAEARVIVTFDRDFGEIFHLRERGALGVIILRLANQTVESVNQVLERFFMDHASTVDLEHSMVIIEEHRIRISGKRDIKG